MPVRTLIMFAQLFHGTVLHPNTASAVHFATDVDISSNRLIGSIPSQMGNLIRLSKC